MTLEWVHPGLLLILGAWLVPFLRGNAKRLVMIDHQLGDEDHHLQRYIDLARAA